MVKRNYQTRTIEKGFTIIPASFDDGVDYSSGQGVPDPFNDDDSIQRWPLGSMLLEGAIRRWAYVENGGVALAPGKLVQSPIAIVGHENMATAAAVTGATVINVTPVTANVVADFYNGGALWVNDVTGEGQMRRIQATPAITAAAAGNLTLEDGIKTALDATSQTSIVPNPYKEVIIHPSPNTTPILGVPATPITASRFGWIVIAGPTAILVDGTWVVGQHIRASDATDGAAEPLDRDGTAEDEEAIGTILQIAATTEYGWARLELGG